MAAVEFSNHPAPNLYENRAKNDIIPPSDFYIKEIFAFIFRNSQKKTRKCFYLCKHKNKN